MTALQTGYRLFKRRSLLPFITPLAFSVCMPVHAAPEGLTAALSAGKTALEFRYRFDHVEDEARARDANASTLRTRLNYTSGAWNDLTGFVEMDNVSRIGDDRYNDNRNGKTLYATVPDPDGTDLNQAYLRYAGAGKAAVTLGRQRVGFDNHRIIGFTPGRQNEQTLDGLLVEYKGVDKLTANLGYMTRVNTSSGPDSGTPPAQPPHERDLNMPMLHVRYDASSKIALTGYHFAMDFERDAFNSQGSSQQTTGLRVTGKLPVSEKINVEYVTEAAQQSEHAGQPVSYDAGYWHGDLKLNLGSFYFGVGHETMKSDNGMRFITPLATLKFHGLAEKFWQTPAGGIQDSWVSVGGTLAGWRLMAKHHWLEQETDVEADGSHFGQETNFTAFRALGKNYQLLFVHALFDVKEGAYGNLAFGPVARFDDTQKTYLALMAKF